MTSIAIATPEAGAYRVQAVEGQVVIGRDARCDLVLTARGVSGTHCRLSPMQGLPGAFMLEDLGSKYGTFVNRERVARPVVVSSRDVITVGGHELLLAEEGHEHAALERLRALSAPEPEPAPAQPAPAGALAAFDLSAPWLQQFEHFDALARVWHEKGRPSAGLLSGPAVAVAEQWLAAGVRQSPAPGALHRDFIVRSRTRRSSRVQGVVLGAAAVGLVIAGVVGWYLKGDDIQAALAPPEPVVTEVDSPDVTAPETVSVDVAALAEHSRTVAEPVTRLLVQAALLDVATGQNLPSTSDAVWMLQQSIHAGLAEFRETVLRGHTDAVTTVAFGPSGMLIASGSDDGSARLWDLSNAAAPRSTTLRGYGRPVIGLAFSADGHWLVTGCEDGSLWRWDLRAKDQVGTAVVFKKHDSPVREILWHPNSRFVASGDDDGMLVSWDMTAEPDVAAIWARPAHDGAITDLQFDAAPSPSLYTASDDRTARRWSVRDDGSLARQRTYAEHTGGLTALAVSDDLRWMATATTAGELFLSRRSAAKKKKKAKTEEFPLLGHRDVVTQLAFTPDGHWMVSAGDDGTLHVWDLTVADPSVSSLALTGHTGDITGLDIAVGGERAVSAGTDNTVRVWDLVQVQRVIQREELAGHQEPVESIDVSPDGLWIASGSQDKTVRVWDALGRSPGRGGRLLRIGPRPVLAVGLSKTDRLVAVSEGRVTLWDLTRADKRPEAVTLQGAKGVLNAAAFSPTGRVAAVAGETGEISVWSVGEGATAAPRVFGGHTGSVNALAFTPDGGTLLSVSSDRTVRVWPVSAPDSAKVWTAHQDEVAVLAITAKGDFAFTGSLDGSIVRWSLADGASVTLSGRPGEAAHEGAVRQLRISPDGHTLASGSADRRARVWDVATGKLKHVLRAHDEPVNAVAFGRNGLLATAGEDRTIRVWDLESDHPDEAPKALVGHEQSVTDLAFVGDGGMLVSSSNDATIRLWRLDTLESIALPGHDGVVSKLLLTANEASVVSAGFDGSVRVWPLHTTTLARQICSVVGRGLTDEESAQFFGALVADPCSR